MRFTARSLFACWVIAACAAFSPHARAVEATNEAAIVAQLYKDFAWQAIAGIPNKSENASFAPTIVDSREAVLTQYFSPKLTALLVADAKCRAQTREVCKLDFDPIFASQDPAAADLTIEADAPGKVMVEFTYPSNREKVRIEYRVARVGGNWRITDIIYSSLAGQSLVQLLSSRDQ